MTIRNEPKRTISVNNGIGMCCYILTGTKSKSFEFDCWHYLKLQVASAMTIWNQMQPTLATKLWNEALNIRLGTKVVFINDWNIHKIEIPIVILTLIFFNP